MTDHHSPYNRGIYLLPNIFTTAALFAGFYAIVAAMNGDYAIAAIAIFLGLLADALDGRVARLIRAQSEFGAYYDSLADMVSSGLAPALLLYSWSFSSLGKVGWLVAFMYTASVALRLARFNTQLGVADKRFFQGLPCPAAAGSLAAMVWFLRHLEVDGQSWLSALLGGLTVILALLMVSNVRYYSFKDIDFKGRVPFLHVTLLVLVFIGVALYPALVLLMSFLGYALSGPVMTLLQKQKRRKQRRKKKQ